MQLFGRRPFMKKETTFNEKNPATAQLWYLGLPYMVPSSEIRTFTDSSQQQIHHNRPDPEIEYFQRRPKWPSRRLWEGPMGHLNRLLFFCKTVSHRESTPLIVLTPKDTLFIQLGVALIHQLPDPVVSCSQSSYWARFFFSRTSGEQWLVHLVWPNGDEIYSTDHWN